MVFVVDKPVAIRRPVDFSWSGNDSGVQPRRYQLNVTVRAGQLLSTPDPNNARRFQGFRAKSKNTFQALPELKIDEAFECPVRGSL